MAKISQGGSATYAGRDAGKIIGREIVKGDSLSQGIFTIREYTKGQGVMRSFKFKEGDLDTGVCGWLGKGGEIDNKKVALAPLKANVEVCKQDFNVDWTAFNMQDGASGAMDSEISDVISTEILRAVAIRVDKDIWASIKTEALADGAVLDVTLAAITAANVIAETNKMYGKLAAIEGFEAGNSFIVMSSYNKALLEQAYAAVGTNTAFYLGEKATNFLGVRIVASVGVDNITMFASSVDNMFYFTDLASDQNTVSIKDMDETDLSGNIRFKALWSAGASYAFGERLVLGA